MSSPRFSLGLLGVLAFALASWIEPWFQTWAGNRAEVPNLLITALGDGRHLFARHVYTKADAYFHNGYYPTIYDSQAGFEENHLAGGQEEHGDFLGAPRDWIDRFGRHFFPSRHTHLGDEEGEHQCEHCARQAAAGGKASSHAHDENCRHDPDDAHHDHDHDHDHAQGRGDGVKEDHPGHAQDAAPRAAAGSRELAGGQEREILPWLRLSVTIDPHRIETYTVGAYWLRRALQRSGEAEQFLREGLQHNPANPELLLELGKVFRQDRHDDDRARNLWEYALAQWPEKEGSKPEPNHFLHAQILNELVKLEYERKNYPRTLELLDRLKDVSLNKPAIRKWIDEVTAEQAATRR